MKKINKIKLLKKIVLLICGFLCTANIFAQDQSGTVGNLSNGISLFLSAGEQVSPPDFAEIDNYVLGLKTNRDIGEAELVQLLTEHSQTKIEKARAIFIWLARNIRYDTNYSIFSKDIAFKRHKGVCAAYSELFQSLGELAGLEVVYIYGDAKTSNYKRPSDIDKRGHAWNAVKVDNGRWALVDATWGAGYVEKGKFKRKLNDQWFDPAPEFFVFTHLPKDDNWQLLDKPITRDEFLRMPPLKPMIHAWGFKPDATLSYFTNSSDASLPVIYSIDLDLKISKMPVSKKLKVGNTYEFEFFSPHDIEIAIVSNKRKWVRFQRTGYTHSLTITPKKRGEAVLYVKKNNSKKYNGIIKFDVRFF